MATDMHKLVVSLEAEIGKYQKNLGKAEKQLDKYKKSASNSLGAVKKIFLGLGAAVGLSKLVGQFNDTSAAIDKTAKTAAKLGMLTEELQGLRHAGELSGVSVNTVDMAMQRLTRRVAEAAQGTGEAKGALNELGLDAQVLVNMPISQQMGLIADSMKGVENQSDKVRLAMKLFDSEGVALVNTLAMGSEGLEAAQREVEAYGASFSRIDAAKVEYANDQFTKAKLITKGVSQQLAIEAAPILSGIAAKFLTAAKESGYLGNIGQKAANVLVKGFGFVGNIVRGLEVTILTIRQGFAELGLTVTSFVAKVSSLGAGIAERMGFDAEGLRSIERFRESFELTVGDMKLKLDQKIMEKLPSDIVGEWVQDIQTKMHIAAVEAVEANGGLSSLLLGGEDEDAKIIAEVEAARQKAELIENINARHKKSLLQKEAQFQAKILQFQKASTKDKIKTIFAEGAAMLQGVAHTSKKMFKINKALALADAAVTLPSAVLKAIERGGGLPWGAIFGGITLAAGLARIRAIKKAKFGGGTAASMAGVSGGATQTVSASAIPSELKQVTQAKPEQSKPNTQIILQGDIWDADKGREKILNILASASADSSIQIRDRSGRLLLERT